jgi:hypothetical protein
MPRNDPAFARDRCAGVWYIRGMSTPDLPPHVADAQIVNLLQEHIIDTMVADLTWLDLRGPAMVFTTRAGRRVFITISLE